MPRIAINRNKSNTSTELTDEKISDDSKVNLTEIKEMLANINSRLIMIETNQKSVNNDIKEIKNSLSFMSDRYDELLEIVNNQRDEIKIVSNDLNNYKTKCQEQNILIEDLNERLSDLEQYTRINNIEVFGVKENPEEDCKEIIEKIASELQLNISKADIENAHRLPNAKKTTPPSIVAQFKSRAKRDMLVAKRALIVTKNSFQGTAVGTKLFINEHLTSQNKRLLMEAKQKAREVNYKYIWYKNGKIFARKYPDSQIIRIKNSGDVQTKLV